jgi:hypothetical protein
MQNSGFIHQNAYNASICVYSTTTSTVRDGSAHRVSEYTGLFNDLSPNTSSHERT